MAIIYSISNMKGGVGKTTTAVNLAYGLARMEYKVLLIDSDPQANATFACNLLNQLDNNLYTCYKAIAETGKSTVKDALFRNVGGIDIIPSDLALSLADIEFSTTTLRELMLQRIIEPIKSNYEVIIIDNPPALSLLTMNSLAISDYVLIPVMAEFLPAKGLDLFINGVKRFLSSNINPTLDIGGIIISKYDGRTILAKQLIEFLEESFPGLLFKAKIRQNIAISEAQAAGKSIFEYDLESNGAKDFEALTEEIIQRFSGNGEA